MRIGVEVTPRRGVLADSHDDDERGEGKRGEEGRRNEHE